MWQEVEAGVWLFQDSCLVYAVVGEQGSLIINAGTGKWLAEIDSLPAPPIALVCTHYFRDHSAGTLPASRAGIPIYVPEGDRALFTDPNQHFRQRETYIIYDNLWDLYAPIEAIPVAGVLQDYATIGLAGFDIEVIPLPGVTLTQVGLGVTLKSGKRVVFCGEAIHSPGKIARVAPFQYNYNDLPGAVQCFFSTKSLRKWQPDALFPSLGEPILSAPDSALEQLQANLRHLVAPRQNVPEQIDYMDAPPLQKITEHVWLDTHSVANTWYIVSESGKVLAIDYGYHGATRAAWHGYPKPERRRALLHGLEGLKAQFGVDRIDTVLVSHFHDDHVCGIPVLQRVFGTQCWAAENFADLLDYPETHNFPCCWIHPMKVNRRLSLNETFQWEEYTFCLHPMNGHTRFSALIGFEADGVRFAHTGDQYFFDQIEDFSKSRRAQNHVYRNGAMLDGYTQSGEWMLNWRPDIVLQGHQPAMHTDTAFFEHIQNWVQDYAETHRRIMPLSDTEVHFDMDSWGGWITPYRTVLPEVRPFSVTATVRNPFPHKATLQVSLVGLTGWEGSTAEVEAEGRAEVSCELKIVPNGTCRRQPIAIELSGEGRVFGQVAEALVTIGGTEF